jgi:HPr kinase/phosphorylase
MNQFEKLHIIQKESVPVSFLLESPVKPKLITHNLNLENRFITDKNLHRPQLALAGYVGLFTYNRVQIFGNTEVNYLSSLFEEDRKNAIARLSKFPIPCILLTNNNSLDDELIQLFHFNGIPVFSTEIETTRAFSLLSEFLDDQFSMQATIHGSLVDVYGVGMLLIGRSGIGKSEITLDLIERGHRLVADDIVMITKTRESIIMGTGTNLVQHFMEIRGLGILDIRQMFGVRSVRFQKRLEVIVELEDWSERSGYTRTGLEDIKQNVMGVEIDSVKLPIFPGKNITVIAEVIALNYLLKTYGYNASESFTTKLKETIAMKTKNNGNFGENRIISYFQGDRE